MSKITGKLVTIRHVTGRDLPGMREYLQKHHGDCLQKDADVVTAVENDRLIGLGILQRIGETSASSSGIFAKKTVLAL